MNKNLLDVSPKIDDKLTLAREIERQQAAKLQPWLSEEGWRLVISALRQDSSDGVPRGLTRQHFFDGR